MVDCPRGRFPTRDLRSVSLLLDWSSFDLATRSLDCQFDYGQFVTQWVEKKEKILYLT